MSGIRRVLLGALGFFILLAAFWTVWRDARFYGLAFGVGWLLVLTIIFQVPPRKLQRTVHLARVPLTIVVFSVTAFGMGFSERIGSLSFYEVSAQVIPALLLVLAIEIRLTPTSVESPFDITFPVMVLLALGLGEFSAFKALATETPTANDFKHVVVALVTGFAGVVLAAVAPPPATSDSKKRDPG